LIPSPTPAIFQGAATGAARPDCGTGWASAELAPDTTANHTNAPKPTFPSPIPVITMPRNNSS
ncbi:MAG: hypothetical protein QOH32_4413, partial [Bradyrhizobium sp.]|nr:hypothetical protein [Bradyrhizobium sp.]